MKKIEMFTLSEDQVVEALSRYLRDGPFKYSFDELTINTVVLSDDDNYIFNVELSDES